MTVPTDIWIIGTDRVAATSDRAGAAFRRPDVEVTNSSASMRLGHGESTSVSAGSGRPATTVASRATGRLGQTENSKASVPMLLWVSIVGSYLKLWT